MYFKKRYIGLFFLSLMVCSYSLLFVQRYDLIFVRNTPHHATIDQNTSQRLDEYFAYEKKTLLIKGMAVSIFKNESIDYLREFGEANREHSLLTNETVFPIGSLSNIFTIIGIFQLVEAGLLSFNTSVMSVLPEFQTKSTNTNEITVNHCINHLSGLPSKINNRQTSVLSTKEMLSNFQQIKLVSIPGATFQYSLLNYVLLGAIIEQISNQSYADYIQSHICEPLNMTSTFVSSEPDFASNSFRISEGFQLWFALPLVTALELTPGLLAANGIFSTSIDMTHLFIGILNYNDTNPFTPILSDDSLSVMWSQSYPNENYVNGWSIISADNRIYYYQSSDLHGFHSECLLIPSNKTGIIILLNTNSLLSSLGYYNMLPFNGFRALESSSIYARQVTFGLLYILLDLLVAFSLFLEAWRIARLKKVVDKRFEEYFDFRERRKRMIGDLIGEFIGTVLIIFVFPWLMGLAFGISAGFTLTLMLEYQLDLFLWLLIIGGINLGKVGLQIWYSRADLFH